MRLVFATAVVAAAVVEDVRAQAPVGASPSATALGTWRGTSVCLVRPSPCNNEVVVYRITRRPGRDSIAIDARKIVRGQEEDMGVLSCQASPAVATAVDLTCPIPNGVWRFHVRGDSLVGELRRPDSTRFRDVRTARAP